MNKRGLVSILKSRVAGYSGLIAILAILGTLAGFFGKYHFIFDICTNFRLLSTPTLLICGVIHLIFAKRKWFGYVSLAVGIALLWSFVPYSGGIQQPSESADLRIMSYNVLTSNQEKDKVADYILHEDPDVVILLEVDAAWNVAMTKRLSETYPKCIVLSRGDNFGIAAFSKQPFESAEIRDFGDEDTPCVDLYIDSVRIIGTHPVPPMSREGWESRNRQMKAIANDAARTKGPMIVCGDFNCSQWSPFMRQFMDISGLQDPAKIFGIKPTWTAFGGVIGLPIDHVFHSKELKVIERKIGAAHGSDHKPVVVGFVYR